MATAVEARPRDDNLRDSPRAGRRPAPQPANRADLVVRRLLLIPETPGTAPGTPATPTVAARDGNQPTEEDAHRLFSTSILLSALRCLMSYVALPVVTPLAGAAAGVAPAIGIPIAVVALAFDLLGIRRFFAAGHRLRWPVTVIYLAVMGMVAYLLAGDIAHFI